MSAKIVFCYQCKHFKPKGKGVVGWCQYADRNIRVESTCYCARGVLHRKIKEVIIDGDSATIIYEVLEAEG